MVLKNVIRTYWGMQKSKMQNHIMCPLRGLVQHRPKNPPNLGRMGCLCQLLSPKGHMIWFLFFHYMFPVAKWVRKYPPCALHKTFLVRCLRKYSVYYLKIEVTKYICSCLRILKIYHPPNPAISWFGNGIQMNIEYAFRCMNKRKSPETVL